jgi:putative sugar O-methyltransferase
LILFKRVKIAQAQRLISLNENNVLFVTSLLRAREIKMAEALRAIGWTVILAYSKTTPFDPEAHFDLAISTETAEEVHELARILSPKVCHVFSGAVDDVVELFCEKKPTPIVIDMNDVFAPSLFDYCEERFEPTKKCLKQADGFCGRDLQLNTIRRLDGWKIPDKKIFFPEYCWNNLEVGTVEKLSDEEVHVVSIGTFCLEKNGQYDSGYLKLAQLLTEQKIHFHIYPHWFYRQARNSSFNWSLRDDFSDFFELQKHTPYLHIHECLPLDELMKELPKYDFGIVSGGSDRLDQTLSILKRPYLDACYSGRISDYLDAHLPVLINSEVKFNCRMMERYGVLLDLDDIFAEGFREKLITAKKDPRMIEKVRQAASALSLTENAHRLGEFYDDVAADSRSVFSSRPGRLEFLLSFVPIIRRGTYRAYELREKYAASASENRRLETQLDETNATFENLERNFAARIENTERKFVHTVSEKTQIQEELKLTNEKLAVKVAECERLEKAEALSRKLQKRDREKYSEVLRQIPLFQSYIDKKSADTDIAGKTPDELSGLLWWPEMRNKVERANGFNGLLRMCGIFEVRSDEFSKYSNAWTALSKKNFDQLVRDGFNNFKQTIATNYFTFLVQQGDPQIEALESLLSDVEIAASRNLALAEPDDPNVDIPDQFSYRYFVHLLWAYAVNLDVSGNLQKVSEPTLGNPFQIHAGKQLISQDLANSVIEYYSMTEVVDFEECKRVLEIGAGYGRDAHAILTLNPDVQYFFVDVPPSLFIAQKYMTMIFPERTAFLVQDFESFDEVREEIEAASLVFLLPHQLEALPDDYVGLTISISNLGEMTKRQISEYSILIDRVTNGFAYNKQWNSSINPFDDQVITMSEYPTKANWREIYMRKCPANPEFFESMHRIGPSK